MCGNCKRDLQSHPASCVIDWSRIPSELNEVRRLLSGSVWAGLGFRVLDSKGNPEYRSRKALTHAATAYAFAPILGRRPPVRSDYLIIHCPGLYPEMVRDVTKDYLQDHLTKAGYGPQIRVYKLELVAEAKQVEVKTVETQLIWSN